MHKAFRKRAIMTNITFTEKEELVLQVSLDNAWEPNMISFGDIVHDERIKDFGSKL
jgi:hypothetical protein